MPYIHVRLGRTDKPKSKIIIPYLAQLRIFHLEQAGLHTSTARGVDVVAKSVHSVHESLKTASVWRDVAAEECLFRQGRQQLVCNERVRLVAKLFDDFVSS